MFLGADGDPQGSGWAAYQQDMITGDCKEETVTFLEVEARESSVFVNSFDSWSGNNASLIAQSMGLLWDIWLPLLPKARLKETGLICGSIP